MPPSAGAGEEGAISQHTRTLFEQWFESFRNGPGDGFLPRFVGVDAVGGEAVRWQHAMQVHKGDRDGLGIGSNTSLTVAVG